MVAGPPSYIFCFGILLITYGVLAVMDINHLTQEKHCDGVFLPDRKVPESVIDELCSLACMRLSSHIFLPWHFIVASTAIAKSRINQVLRQCSPAMAGLIDNASHLIVLCERPMPVQLAHETIQEQEASGLAVGDTTFRASILPLQDPDWDERDWAERQIYIALGSLLLGAATLGIDTFTVDMFDARLLDEELELFELGLTSSVIVAVGYHGNCHRCFATTFLPPDIIMTRL